MRWLAVVLVAGCAPTIDISRPEDAPVASILVPTDGSVVDAGRLEALGQVHDSADAPEHLFAVWSLGAGSGADITWRDVCSGFAEADGLTRCLADVSTDDTTLRLQVKDLAGFLGQAFADLVVQDVAAPVVTLLAPTSVGPYYADVPVALRAAVDDADDALDDLRITWSSSAAGTLEGPDVPDGDGVVAGAVSLPEGEHRITVAVTDPGDLRATDEVVILVGPANEVPQVRIDAPGDGTAVRVGTAVTLAGVVVDDRTPSADVEATWSSDRDGTLGVLVPDALGYVALPDVVLSGGDHVLTLTGRDDVGGVATASVQVHVDTPPGLDLQAPRDAAVLSSSLVAVDAVLTDAVSPPTALRLAVRSDRQGQVADVAADASGEVHVVVTLAPGPHELTVTAVDGYGLSTQDVIAVTVAP
ncbi:MAG: hypothetical protein H6733_08775 [Alphaproteobacteria bacterium]|nr:hypothetical protein [Alphaproteobacteria bacterium]